MAEQVKGLIFDMDGTLLDSHGPLCDAYNATIRQFGHPGLTHKQIIESMGQRERMKFIWYVGLFKTRKAGRVLRENVRASLSKVGPFPGVIEMLDRLKSRGYPITVVTSAHRILTEAHLKRVGIADRFTTVITFEDVKKVKPHAEPVRLALRRLGVEPAQAWMIGDTWKDMEAARGAGTPAVAALWDSLVSMKELERYEPLHWVRKPGELADLLA